MSRSVVIALFVGVAAIVAAVGASISTSQRGVEAAACADPAAALPKLERTVPPRPVPEGGLFEERGRERSLADYRGKGLVVNFWATWCAPCVKELPALDRLAALAGEGLTVLALSLDRDGGVVEPFLAKYGIRNLSPRVVKRGPAFRALDIGALPTTLLIGADGAEAGRVVGIAEWDAPKVAGFLAACLAPGATAGG